MGWGTGNIGGGTSLNFKVIGGTYIPSSQKENIICVNTNEEITSYIFSETEPKSPYWGMVWFPIREASPVAFNALKKNGIFVCPVSAKQYIGGVWVDKPAKIRQGGLLKTIGSNWLINAIAADGTLYNNGQGWKTGYRLNSSGAEVAMDRMEVTGFLPVAYGDTVYLKDIGWNISLENANQSYIWAYDANFTPIAFAIAVNFRNGTSNLPTTAEIDSRGILKKFVVDSAFLDQNVSGSLSKVAYLRLNCETITGDSIITVNLPIE